jgi:hypothetical protein
MRFWLRSPLAEGETVSAEKERRGGMTFVILRKGQMTVESQGERSVRVGKEIMDPSLVLSASMYLSYPFLM